MEAFDVGGYRRGSGRRLWVTDLKLA